MWRVRAVRIDDLDALHDLVQSATKGLTSLQLDRDRLLDRIEQSAFAFSRTGLSPRGEPYVLVLVDDTSGELVGTATIYAKSGGYQPLYAYRLVESDHHSELLGVRQHRTILQLERIHDGPTEIGSLFLRGKYRGEGRGRWLSLSRFALIAMMPHRFADRVIAEMRGKSDADGTVPFWEAVAGRFIPTDFAVVDAMSTINKQFIEEMMPQHPIYLDLLPDEIRRGIGEVHPETVPAIGMLRREGFQATDLVDIFDAGPMVSCETDQIGAVRRCRDVSVVEIADRLPQENELMILCSSAGGFTSVYRIATLNEEGVVIDRETADALQLQVGSRCMVMATRPSDS